MAHDLVKHFTRHINSQHFQDVLLTLTSEGVIKEINDASETVFGYEAAQMAGKNYLNFVFEEDAEDLKQYLHSVQFNTATKNFIQRSLHRNGGLCHINWSASWLEEEKMIFAICRDVTQLVMAQKKQLAAEQLFQALIENSFDLLALVDDKGNYLYVSESFYNTFEYNQRVLQGYTASEMVGTNCFSYMHPEDLPRLMQQYYSLFNGERKLHVPPFRFRNASGVYRWTEAIVTNHLDNPEIKAIVVSARDVHHQMDNELKLKEMQMLEAVMEGEENERRRIARDLHDEVSGMIAAAKMHFSALIEKAPQVATTREYANVMNLLQNAALQIRRTSHNLMPEIVLEGGMDAALKRYCSCVTSDRLKVNYFSLGNIGRFTANFELSLYRITQELINNIIKHAEASEAMVQISQQNNVLSVTIEDNGKGFHQCRHAKGTGINSVCKRMEAMNGHMEVTSEPGRGTSIYLEFEI